MYKNIIPGLVSLETKLNNLNGFYFSEKFDFFGKIEKVNIFHYKIIIDNNIKISSEYDYINGHFFKKDNCWYYLRKIGFITFKFCFDENSNTFIFNRFFLLLPFEIGHIFPIGRLIADFIHLHLFLKGYLVFFGSIAINYNDKNIFMICSSGIGKTSFINSSLNKGVKLISEGLVVVDLKKKIIYPRHYRDFYGSKHNQILAKKILINQLITSPVKLNKTILIRTSTNPVYFAKKRNFFEYFFYRSLFFLKSPYIDSVIFKNKLTKKVFSLICKYKNETINHHFKEIKNFSFYEKIIKNEK